MKNQAGKGPEMRKGTNIKKLREGLESIKTIRDFSKNPPKGIKQTYKYA